MLEVIKELISDVYNLTSIVTNSKQTPLKDKVQARAIETVMVDKLNTMLSVNPYGSQKIVKDYLSIGDANRIVNISLSNINLCLTNLSSLIFTTDKEITNINLNCDLLNKPVKNSFLGITGVVKIEVSTASEDYLIVLGDDSHYHFTTKKFWKEA